MGDNISPDFKKENVTSLYYHFIFVYKSQCLLDGYSEFLQVSADESRLDLLYFFDHENYIMSFRYAKANTIVHVCCYRISSIDDFRE